MTAVAERKRSWRRPTPPIDRPTPTTDDRMQAFEQLDALEARRGEVVTLEATAAKLKTKWDEANEIADAAKAKFLQARAAAGHLSASLDAQGRRATAVLRRTCPGAIDEFLQVIDEERRRLQDHGILTTAIGKGYSLDGHVVKQSYSNAAALGNRMKSLARARSEAEALKTAQLTTQEIEDRLQALFESLPSVEFEECQK